MFHYADFDRFVFLAVAHLDLERFIKLITRGVDQVVCSLALADEVEGVSGKNPYGFVFRCVVDDVFTGKLDLSVGVAAVEAGAALRQRGGCGGFPPSDALSSRCGCR